MANANQVSTGSGKRLSRILIDEAKSELPWL